MSAKNSDLNSDVWFTVDQLAEIGLPGYPRTGRRWHNRAKAEAWKSREVASQGRTGYRTEYTPPPEVMALIEARQRGAQPAAPASKSAHTTKEASLSLYRVQEPTDPHGEIDGVVLDACLRACSTVYGEQFDKLPSAQQMTYAVDLYNLLVRMCHSQGVAISSVKRLETKGLAEQLGAFIKLGWALKFPAPTPRDCFF